MREGLQGECEVVVDGFVTYELLIRDLFNRVVVHSNDNQDFVVRPLLEIRQVQDDIHGKEAFVPTTIFRSYFNNFDIAKLLVHHVLVIDGLHNQVEQGGAALHFEPASKRRGILRHFVIDAGDNNFVAVVGRRGAAETELCHKDGLVPLYQLALAILFHQSPQRNVVAVAFAVREVRQVRNVQHGPLVPVQRRRNPQVSVLYCAMDCRFEVKVILCKRYHRQWVVQPIRLGWRLVERERDEMLFD